MNLSPLLFLMVEGIPPAEMSQIVAARQAALDKLVVRVQVRRWLAEREWPVLNQSGWMGSGRSGDHRVTIVRPGVLHEVFRGGAQPAETALATWITGGSYTRRFADRLPDGTQFFRIAENAFKALPYVDYPFLQVFDVHIQDSSVPYLNIAKLFAEYAPELVGAQGDTSSYRLTLPMAGYVAEYEIDLNSRGTPLRFKTTLTYSEPGAEPRVREMFTRSTRELNGFEFCDDVVVGTYNPNPPGHQSIFHFSVTEVQHNPALTTAQLAVVPEERNSTILRERLDGSTESRVYDEAGNLVRTEYGAAPPQTPAPKFAGRESPAWRMLVPPVAVAVGVVAGITLWFVSRRARGTCVTRRAPFVDARQENE